MLSQPASVMFDRHSEPQNFHFRLKSGANAKPAVFAKPPMREKLRR